MSAMLREAGLLKELAEANERVRQLEKERERLKRCRELLAEARDDVNSILNDILVLGNYPHNERRIRIQQELLANIDAAIAGEEKCTATYAGPSSTACDDQLAAGAEDFPLPPVRELQP